MTGALYTIDNESRFTMPVIARMRPQHDRPFSVDLPAIAAVIPLVQYADLRAAIYVYDEISWLLGLSVPGII